MQPAVFLDRDGVINHAIIKKGKPYPPENLAMLTLLPDTLSALQLLKAEGFKLIVVTNQPDVARGTTSKETVDEINCYLQQHLPLDAIHVCFHDDKDNCDCRKPKAGLLMAAAKNYQLQLTDCYMIGDRWKDIAAGHAAACKTIWLKCNYDEPFLAKDPHFVAQDLLQAAKWIISDKNKEKLLT